MKRFIFLVALISTAAFAQSGKRAIAPNDSFASNQQTIPVVANTIGLGGAVFRSYVAILNPTPSGFTVTASFYDASGTKKDATITLAAGEMRVYGNFLATVFSATGGGAVTLSSPDPSNRFVVSSEVQTGDFSTSVPALEFAGSNSRSFAPGINVNSTSRTNVGCFNQADAANSIKATVLDSTGKLIIGSALVALTWLVEAIACGAVFGPFWGIALLALAPLLSYIALRWGESWRELREAAGYAWLTARHKKMVTELVARRRALTERVAEAVQMSDLTTAESLERSKV
jgi:hypothetical protein